MLYITFKETEDMIFNVDSYFNMNYDPEWFNDPIVKDMVRDVDRSEVLGPYCIQSPVLGQISPTILSGGVKALILMLKEPELILYATACGDNCAEWILKISEMHDLTIVLKHTMRFERDFDAICLDNNQEIHNLDDYIFCRAKCL